jgi:hypothetical protein
VALWPLAYKMLEHPETLPTGQPRTIAG